MIQLRHQQPSLWDGVWAEEVGDLWEPWMRAADRLLEDEELLSQVFEAQPALETESPAGPAANPRRSRAAHHAAQAHSQLEL